MKKTIILLLAALLLATPLGAETWVNGVPQFNNADINNPDIDGGTIDGATIATSDITVGAGKTIDVSAGTLTLADDQISGAKVADATSITAGVVELATDAETAAGTATDKVTTPANIASVYAYQTIYIPASAMTPTTTNGAVGGTYEYGTNDVTLDYMAYDGATEQFAGFITPFPEGWDRGTIKAKFVWSSATGSTAGDTVEWEIGCVAISDNDALDVAIGTAQVISDTLLANDGAKSQATAATPALTVGGTPALGDMIYCKVSRNVGGTDDMTENAWLFGAWIQYKAANTVAAW